MFDKVLDYVTVENVIPKEFCEQMIVNINGREWQKHTWPNPDDTKRYSEKTKELDIQAIDQSMQNQITPFLLQAGETYLQKFSETGGKMGTFISRFTPVRFNRYQEGTKMRKHYDHIHSIFDGDKKGIPILSFVGVFNDNYEGGRMLVKDVDYPLKQGDIIIMPSCFLFPHEVTEITKGTRYSFVSWAF